MDWAAGDRPEAARLRAAATLIVVPLMDVDNVELGNGGKDQAPYDHCRDYTENPIYASVRATQPEMRRLIQEHRLLLFFDLHSPGWSGPFEWWLASLDNLPRDVRARAEQLAGLFRGESARSITFKGFKLTGSSIATGRAPRLWLARTTGESVVSATLEIPIAPPPGFVHPPPTQHLHLGVARGRSMVRWINEVQK
jgi:hypothetical protein